MATSAAFSEHFEKLHQIFCCLHEDLQGVPEQRLGTAGAEEKKKEDGKPPNCEGTATIPV
uniref:Uncharacterized protein n=1 Tax=Lynx canadensis TaxID=61383 RepID=A0A667HFH2_LYNCA